MVHGSLRSHTSNRYIFTFVICHDWDLEVNCDYTIFELNKYVHKLTKCFRDQHEIGGIWWLPSSPNDKPPLWLQHIIPLASFKSERDSLNSELAHCFAPVFSTLSDFKTPLQVSKPTLFFESKRAQKRSRLDKRGKLYSSLSFFELLIFSWIIAASTHLKKRAICANLDGTYCVCSDLKPTAGETHTHAHVLV